MSPHFIKSGLRGDAGDRFDIFGGRTALGWFVDMTAIGGAIGFGYTTAACFATILREGKATRYPGLTACAILGTLFSLGFCVLLLVPGLPGSLSTPSYILLAIWTALGFLFWLKASNPKSPALGVTK